MSPVIFIKIDLEAVNHEVRTSSSWREHCEQLATKGLSHARSIAPVKTGAYKASLYAEVGHAVTPDSVQGAPAAIVGTRSPYGLEVEFQAPARHHVLLRSLDSLASRT